MSTDWLSEEEDASWERAWSCDGDDDVHCIVMNDEFITLAIRNRITRHFAALPSS
jgi:hypothetical protein